MSVINRLAVDFTGMKLRWMENKQWHIGESFGVVEAILLKYFFNVYL